MGRYRDRIDGRRKVPFPGERGPMARLWRRLPLSLEPIDDLIRIFSFPDAACSDADPERDASGARE